MIEQVLQSEMARAEAAEILLVEKNILKDDVPIISFLQNSVTSAYLLSAETTLISEANASQMLMQHLQFKGDRLPWLEFEPTKVEDGQRYYTGRQVFSCILPRNMNLHKGDVKIHNGVMLEGQWTSKTLNGGGGGLIHTMVRDYGDTFAADFISGTYTFLAWYAASVRGISVGVDDCYVPREVLGVEELAYKAEAYFHDHKDHDIHARTLDSGRQEDNMCRVLDRVRDVMGHRALEPLNAQTRDNGMRDMVLSGAKGKITNLVQTAAAMGQQRNHQSKRFPMSTCHYTHLETDRTRAHGMIYDNFTLGMDSMAMFHHLMASRSGLVDTVTTVLLYFNVNSNVYGCAGCENGAKLETGLCFNESVRACRRSRVTCSVASPSQWKTWCRTHMEEW